MDVDRTVLNSTYDDCTKNSTQDHTSVQVHHNHDISSNLHNKKNKKLHKSLHEFDSDEDNDGDNKPIKNKRESLQTNERSIRLSQILQYVLDPNFACVYP
jgi:hypothetical protein